MKKYLEISKEITKALRTGKPVVALESTIISHGMPYPFNVETAKAVEALIRTDRVVPATIGILEGKIKIGFSDADFEFFGKARGIAKASRRDIPIVLAEKIPAATTVSGTMICAAMAGIKVMVTGGIGGVHRGGQQTFDISADLQELAQTNVAVVCAGPKAILDLPLTMEYLETLGVPVIGYRTNDLPAFFSRESGQKNFFRCDTPIEIASIIRTKWELGLKGGILICKPIPRKYSLPKAEIEEKISKALEKAAKKKITGKNLTPFLLGEINELSGGKSLEANIALIKNNASLGAKIAYTLNSIEID